MAPPSIWWLCGVGVNLNCGLLLSSLALVPLLFLLLSSLALLFSPLLSHVALVPLNQRNHTVHLTCTPVSFHHIHLLVAWPCHSILLSAVPRPNGLPRHSQWRHRRSRTRLPLTNPAYKRPVARPDPTPGSATTAYLSNHPLLTRLYSMHSGSPTVFSGPRY